MEDQHTAAICQRRKIEKRTGVHNQTQQMKARKTRKTTIRAELIRDQFVISQKHRISDALPQKIVIVEGAEIDKAQDLWYSLPCQIGRCGNTLQSIAEDLFFRICDI